jgi:hypothetical protein
MRSVCVKPLGRGPSRCDWAAREQRPRDTNGPINGYKMDRVGVDAQGGQQCVVVRCMQEEQHEVLDGSDAATHSARC